MWQSPPSPVKSRREGGGVPRAFCPLQLSFSVHVWHPLLTLKSLFPFILISISLFCIWAPFILHAFIPGEYVWGVRVRQVQSKQKSLRARDRRGGGWNALRLSPSSLVSLQPLPMLDSEWTRLRTVTIILYVYLNHTFTPSPETSHRPIY